MRRMLTAVTARCSAAVFIIGLASQALAAQVAPTQPRPAADLTHSNRFTLLAGMSQLLLLGGGNVEGTWYTRRMSFDYSHGFNLRLTGSFAGSQEKDQRVELSQPWTTGFGVGYRVTSSFDVRLEPKLHRYRVYYEGQELQGTPITSYSTATLGVGAYYRYYPFARQSGWARGVVLAPSVRYWPNVWSSLGGDAFRYNNTRTGRTETLKAASQGIPGTSGLFGNISIGYTF